MKIENIIIPNAEVNSRLDHFLKRHKPEWPYGLIARWCRQKKIKLNNVRTSPGARLELNDKLTLPLDSDPQPQSTSSQQTLTKAQRIFFERLIIHQDDKLVVINKPPGLATQGGTGIATSVDQLASAYFKGTDNKEAFIVHRLDRSTSGILLISKDLVLTKELTQAFKDKTIKKTYIALVEGHLSESSGTINSPLSIQNNQSEKVVIDADGKPAITHFKLLEHQGPNSLVQLMPETGRMHQLRVHMASLGHPIIGDDKYARAREQFKFNPELEKRLYLHAYRIEIPHLQQAFTVSSGW
tara:strand:+ start:3332 stop:4225 length:894 start_codon:yes stop_codon:yes gene_type:complete